MRHVKPFSDAIQPDEINSSPEVSILLKASQSLKPVGGAANQTDFNYLFPELQKDSTALLPTSASTVQALKDLGGTMSEPGTEESLDSEIPSAYVYFGQFIDHDITLMDLRQDLSDPNLVPLTPAQISAINNLRSPRLDLDSVYSNAPPAGDDQLLVGEVFDGGQLPPGKPDRFFDLPRLPRSDTDPRYDRTPRIGDARNEETITIAQLHVAFLRAHNAIVEAGYDHCAARSLLRRYYQLILVHDFLPRVADPEVVTEMLSGPWKHYNPDEGQFFMPLEFSGAAFRFGHSMVRGRYRINLFRTEFLPQLFDALANYERLADNWVIQWENFFEGGPEVNKARLIDTQVAAPLFNLPGPKGQAIRLPVQTLLRGYMLSLPTGQAVAQALELKPEERMSDEDIEAVAARLPDGAQLAELRKERVTDDGKEKWKLSARTPLWFYILAEAAHSRLVLKRGDHLGPVGSRLVAGVLAALVRRSKDSILKIPGWPPARDLKFTLSDLLRLAGAL
ncbi:MAG TPA: peroxidase family protein [Pyrinomonadaceae bacterium]|jgi:hypothetical protein